MPEGVGGAPAARTVPARHAASLLLVRNGTEVLMGMRGAKHRFMPNRLVFPGGGVERGDARAPAAREPRPEVLALLGRAASPARARALAMAVVRETLEETGLAPGSPPALDGLDYLCRAVTPPGLPIRFNARFLIADAEGFSGTLAGSGELEGLRWYPIAEALALDLALVTREILGQAQTWLALSPAARAARQEVPVFRLKRWRQE